MKFEIPSCLVSIHPDSEYPKKMDTPQFLFLITGAYEGQELECYPILALTKEDALEKHKEIMNTGQVDDETYFTQQIVQLGVAL